MKSSFSTTRPTDFCGVHTSACCVWSHLFFSSSMEHILSQKTKRESAFIRGEASRRHSVYSSIQPTLRPGGVKKRIGLPAGHSPQIKGAMHRGSRSPGQSEVLRRRRTLKNPPCFPLDFICCWPSRLLTHLQSYLSPSLPLPSPPFQFPQPSLSESIFL